MALKEENFVVLHSGSWSTKAGINVIDTNKPPSVTIRSLVGARTVSHEPMDETPADTTESTEKDKADSSQREGSDGTEIKVENSEDENTTMAAAATEDSQDKQGDQTKEQDSDKPQTVYYCGSALTEAMQQYPESELSVSTPIQDGIVKDWAAMEALWQVTSHSRTTITERHVLFRELGIKRSRNASPVLMVVPSEWTKEEHERITQIFFENFNVPGLYLAEESLMILYGCGAITGLVIDIGHNSTEITPIIDTQIQRNATQSIPIAGADFDAYFLEQLKNDTQLVREYGQPLDLEFARFLKESDVCRILTPEEKESKARVEVEYNGKKLTVGAARYKAIEPLFNPDFVGKRVFTLIDAVHAALFSCKAEKRPSLWEAIIITGGLQGRIQYEIEKSLVISENFGEFQTRDVKFLKVPDYFPTLKDSIVHAGFLGAEIVAKLIFPDPRNYINKVDYNEGGPSVVHTKTF
ncbi:hypothetical protein BGW38_004581 [Lunasporangiospora selenospora]|uniref:Uncharacterized protein n=1 Tax=Lunasporangiospora selenospora TaxID=979761 RepID=A0A9P6G171_9FUNG|nr:hypothetical protein BGW38_004581 [Lunasporangiospora selenospora]